MHWPRATAASAADVTHPPPPPAYLSERVYFNQDQLNGIQSWANSLSYWKYYGYHTLCFNGGGTCINVPFVDVTPDILSLPDNTLQQEAELAVMDNTLYGYAWCAALPAPGRARSPQRRMVLGAPGQRVCLAADQPQAHERVCGVLRLAAACVQQPRARELGAGRSASGAPPFRCVSGQPAGRAVAGRALMCGA